ncbi:MAG: hypothetical protein ACR2PY_05335 [Salinispira sp.]
MEDQDVHKNREKKLRQLKQKIRDQNYLRQAVGRLATSLTREYYQRIQR